MPASSPIPAVRPTVGNRPERTFAVGPMNRRCASHCGRLRNATLEPCQAVAQSPSTAFEADSWTANRAKQLSRRGRCEAQLWTSAGGFAVSVWVIRGRLSRQITANAIGADVLADVIGRDFRNAEARSGGLARPCRTRGPRP
jgi:hypothetical protein